MKPHISNLKINAFRGLKNLELSDLGLINLIVGFNNSGKSSILEAIEYFCRPLDPLALINLSRSREVSARNSDPVQTLRWLFPKTTASRDGDFYRLEISVMGQVDEQCKTVATILDGYLADVYFGPTMSADRSEQAYVPTTPPPAASSQKNALELTCLYVEGQNPGQSVKPKEAIFNITEGVPFKMHKTPEAPAISCSMITPITHRIDSLQTRGITSVVKADRKEDLLELLRRFDNEILDITILDSHGYPEAWVNHQQRGFMPLSSFGDGLRRVLVIASGLAMATGGVLLIDEIETAIHKDALHNVFRWLRNAAELLGVQVIATTHSLEAIDAMLFAEAEEFSEVVAYRLPTPGSEERLVRYSGESLRDLRIDGGMEVR